MASRKAPAQSGVQKPIPETPSRPSALDAAFLPWPVDEEAFQTSLESISGEYIFTLGHLSYWLSGTTSVMGKGKGNRGGGDFRHGRVLQM
jgi:hypothetical protein